ncbi:hypothetical protein NEOLEDRAFT_1132128 [Neolentinus lepideus HHB14362 ss-1]|uniref:Uncharacterized protein n=1 Tax=Neolentinus lepideus HHB14362 ss-1 TaxID=1314782 RepID=A0A165TFM1_9AGAM|nr:hypothetical protein NEOLEDRAFT_1132128 [Neolentinus lepideus HHB14362 ss-1]
MSIGICSLPITVPIIIHIDTTINTPVNTSTEPAESSRKLEISATTINAPHDGAPADPYPCINTIHAPPKPIMLPIPPRLPYYASRDQLRDQVLDLTEVIKVAYFQAEADHARMVLMERENGRLRQRAFQKEKKKPKRFDTSGARHMTCDEALDELAKIQWELSMKDVFKEAGPEFRARKAKIEAYKKTLAAEAAAAERVQKAAKKEVQRAAAEAEKEHQKQEKAREREEKRKEKERAAEERRQEQARSKAQKAKQRRMQKANGAARKAAAASQRSAGRCRKAGTEMETVAEEEPDVVVKPVTVRRPVPRPRYKGAQGPVINKQHPPKHNSHSGIETVPGNHGDEEHDIPNMSDNQAYAALAPQPSAPLCLQQLVVDCDEEGLGNENGEFPLVLWEQFPCLSVGAQGCRSPENRWHSWKEHRG